MTNIMDIKAPHFVWIRGLNGTPEPQKWYDPDMCLGIMPQKRRELIIAAWKLTPAQLNLSVDQLAASFPLPANWRD